MQFGILRLSAPTAVCKHSTTCRCTDKCSGCGMGLERCRSLTILCYHSGDNTCDWCYLGCAWTCQDMPTALLAAVLEEVLHLLSSSLSTHRTHFQPCQYSHAVESCLGSIVEVALVSLAVASARRFDSPRRFRQNKPQYQHRPLQRSRPPPSNFTMLRTCLSLQHTIRHRYTL